MKSYSAVFIWPWLAIKRSVINSNNSINAAETEQEGQHPLTGQRAPPISGGT